MKSAKVMPQRFPAFARPELQSSVELKCRLDRPVQQGKKNHKQEKLQHYFPLRIFVLLEEGILLYPNCEHTSRLLAYWKLSIEFQIIQWEIISFEVTGDFNFNFFQGDIRNRQNCRVSCF